MFSVRILTLLLYLSLAADSTGAAPVTMIRYRHALTGFISLHQFRDFLTAIVQSRRFLFFSGEAPIRTGMKVAQFSLCRLLFVAWTCKHFSVYQFRHFSKSPSFRGARSYPSFSELYPVRAVVSLSFPAVTGHITSPVRVA